MARSDAHRRIHDTGENTFAFHPWRKKNILQPICAKESYTRVYRRGVLNTQIKDDKSAGLACSWYLV